MYALLRCANQKACQTNPSKISYNEKAITFVANTCTGNFIADFVLAVNYYIVRIQRIGGCYGFMSKPPTTRRNRVNTITQKPLDGLFLNLIHTLLVIVTWLTFQGQRSWSQRHKKWFSYNSNFHSWSHFCPVSSWGGIGIPSDHSFVPPSVRLSDCLSVCVSARLFTTFQGFCVFADKSLGINGIKFAMLKYLGDLPSADIDADGYCCRFMRSSVRQNVLELGFWYCRQVS